MPVFFLSGLSRNVLSPRFRGEESEIKGSIGLVPSAAVRGSVLLPLPELLGRLAINPWHSLASGSITESLHLHVVFSLGLPKFPLF